MNNCGLCCNDECCILEFPKAQWAILGSLATDGTVKGDLGAYMYAETVDDCRMIKCYMKQQEAENCPEIDASCSIK